MAEEKHEYIEPLPNIFSSEQKVRDIASKFGTPIFVYSQRGLQEQARLALNFPNAFGLTVRYAMKANPNLNILRIFHNQGIHIDASSENEVERAKKAGIPGSHIMLTSQKSPDNLPKTLEDNVLYNVCSLNQLRNYGECFPKTRVSIRINPGLGSGGTNKTNTGGPSSSFGIWNENIPEIIEIAKKYGLGIERIHTHIGSGSDPEIWKKVALMSLDNVKRFIDNGYNIKTLNLGGGYKVGRMMHERSTSLYDCGRSIAGEFKDFEKRTGKKLSLEIEPGTFLVANAGAVVAEVLDIKSTPEYDFIITDSGMTEVTRPSLYGAQHPITIVQSHTKYGTEEYIVSGKCCESGDILTPSPDDPEGLKKRRLSKASVGDLVVIGGAGAYCSGMSTKNYNSYPEAAEVIIDRLGNPHLIRRKQTLEQMTENEINFIK